jgi:hypothetical protein
LNVRLEILITGLLMLSAAMLIENSRRVLPWLLLAMIANFKFQALAPTGLLLAYFVIVRRSFRELFLFGAFSLGAAVFPALIFGWKLNLEAHQQWIQYVGAAIDVSFYTFQHIYAFLKYSLGFEIPYATTKIISLGVAAGLGLWVLLKRSDETALRILRPVALGAAFVCAFSPASQSAAFIFYAPLLMMYFIFGVSLTSIRDRAIWWTGLISGWFFVSLAYSDLVGSAGRDFFFSHALKPLGIMILLMFLFYFDWIRPSLTKTEPI